MSAIGGAALPVDQPSPKLTSIIPRESDFANYSLKLGILFLLLKRERSTRSL